MKRKFFLGVVFVALLAIVSGCQPTSMGSKTYRQGQAQSAMEVYYATILRVSDVTIQHEETGGGAMAGGVAGGIVGSTMGGGRGSKLAAVGGALAGAAVGSAAERAGKTRPGLEIELETDDGRILVVVQEKDDDFTVGDRVRLLKSADGKMRVRQ
ncbi:outer membrane lipoprotein [Desulfatiferula olefinivorans]